MAHPEYIRQKAIQMRRERMLTIDEIAERLALPRTTVYYWVNHIPIPETKRKIRGAAKGRVKGSQAMQAKYAAKRKAAYDEGVASYPTLIAEPGFRDFVCLYIAEGHKRSRHTVAIANSDPSVLRAVKPWIERFTRNFIEYAIQYHADQDLDELRTRWGQELEIDGASIRFQRKSNSNQMSKRTWRSELGVLTIRTNDVLFRSMLQGWVDAIRAEWDATMVKAA